MPPGPAIPENCLTLPEAFIKTIDHFVPAFLPAPANVPDHRDTTRTIYPIEEELLVGMLTFTMKLGARRNIKYKLNNPAFVGSLLRERIKTEMGSLKVFSERLWASFTEVWLDTGRLRAILKQQIQIRFNTS